MSYTCEDYCALAAAVAHLVPEAPEAAILIDTDTMCGAYFRHSAGRYKITNFHSETAPGAFFEEAAQMCRISPEALLQTCGDMRKPFLRYLRREKAKDEPLPGLSVSCGQLDGLYESAYGPALQKLTEALLSQCGADASVILIGQLASFYPAEHTVRQLVTFMPFVPVVDGLLVSPALAVPSAELLELGQQQLSYQEETKKHLKHTLMLQLKQLENGKLVDNLHILAEKGTDMESLAEPSFSQSVLVCADEPLTLFAGSTPFSVRLPARLFLNKKEGRSRPDLGTKETTFQDLTINAQFALGIAEGGPALVVRTENRTAQVPLDNNIDWEE